MLEMFMEGHRNLSQLQLNNHLFMNESNQEVLNDQLI